MEVKKTSHSNLENKRFIFHEIGFIVALAMVFLPLRQNTTRKRPKRSRFLVETSDIEEVLPVLYHKELHNHFPRFP